MNQNDLKEICEILLEKIQILKKENMALKYELKRHNPLLLIEEEVFFAVDKAYKELKEKNG